MSDDQEFINKILARQDTSADDIKDCDCSTQIVGLLENIISDGIMNLNESYIGITNETFTKKEESKKNKADEE